MPTKFWPDRFTTARRGVACLGLLSLLAGTLSCGNGRDEEKSSPTTTSTTVDGPTSSPTSEPATSGTPKTTATTTSTSSSGGPTSSLPTTTTATSSVPTTAPFPTGDNPSVPAGQTLNRVWFLRGEVLTPAYRMGTTARAALADLFAGPSSGDGQSVTSAIPSGVVLRSLRIEDGVATIDLTGRFAAGGGSLSMLARLAQLVFTATEFPGIDSVSLALDGTSIDALGGEGIDVSTPRRREHFDGFKPAIMVSSPLPGEEVSSPFLLTGENTTFENTVRITLADDDGRSLASTFTTGTGPVVDRYGDRVWGPYQASIAFDPGSASQGTLTVFEPSGEGGPVEVMSLPLWFSGESAPELAGASIAPVRTPDTPGGPGTVALLTDVRVGRHAGFERVVFEFENDIVPGYAVEYLPGPVHADPSGLPVAVSGDSYLFVRMSSAAGVDLTGQVFRETYRGPAQHRGRVSRHRERRPTRRLRGCPELGRRRANDAALRRHHAHQPGENRHRHRLGRQLNGRWPRNVAQELRRRRVRQLRAHRCGNALDERFEFVEPV